jgi:2-oxo-4-hydroxy-4-carboxy-5-ureidoimidazoline decarboxylase
VTALEWPDVLEALAAHPRIGERATGADREAAFSRQEQSSAAGELAEDLHAANVAYEERFGWVFLICATGRTAAEILGALAARLGNDEPTEQATVRAELAAIVDLRLAKVFV